MYLYKFPQQQQEKGELFEEGHMPVIAKLSHSFHNPHWSFQYHIHKDQAEGMYCEKTRTQRKQGACADSRRCGSAD